MPFDKWGHPFFYPSAKTAGITGTGTPFFYQQSDDVTNDSVFNDEGHVSNSSGGVWTMSTSGPDAVQIGKNSTTADDIGGCSMNFEQTAARGYAYKADDPRDIELKFLVKFVDSGSDNGFAIEGPTGPHSGSGCCSGFCYKLDIQYRPSTPIFRFRKEMYHVSNSDDPKTGGEFTSSVLPFQLLGHDDWIGVAWVRYNRAGGATSGHNTDDSVVLEFWANPDPASNINNWQLIKRTEDTGNWGNDGDQCNGDSDQIGSWSNMKFRLKSNDSSGEFQFKNLSLREIDPTLSFDDPELPPDPGGGGDPGTGGGTSTLTGTFKFQQDINTYRTQSQCAGVGTGGGGGGGGGGTPTGNTYFFNQAANFDKELSDSSTFQNRTRVVEVCKTSSSNFNGKLVIQLDVPLKKVGTPTTPNISAKIWRSTGIVEYTSPTVIDPATLTTNFQTFTFDFSTNTHVMVPGNRIGVEWTGTSSSNYIECGYNDQGDTSSVYAAYENGAWEEKSSRDFACTAWE